MVKKSHSTISNNAHSCLTFIKNRGGQARLSELKESVYILQDLVNKGQIKVRKTGTGYFVQLQGNYEQV